MNVAIVYSRAIAGISSPLVTVEVHLSRGLPGWSIVGLPEMAVRESKDRVRSAILNNYIDFPLSRIIINLAPADLPKEGGRYDLAIALGIIAASGQIPASALEQYEITGELALTGTLRPVRGILPIATATRAAGRKLIVPEQNADEAALIKELEVFPAKNLVEVFAHLCGTAVIQPHTYVPEQSHHRQCYAELSDIRAQHLAKRALEITAAGGHNLLMTGPPGSGKTMLAERLPGILPPMTESQAMETAAIMSISQHGFRQEYWKKRPIRAPHHTASGIALVGGGGNPRPGEISLAHNGVLFLDELPEFDRRVLEVLREPLESGRIIISRAAQQAEFPASFQLVAAMNPCPCGYLGDSNSNCNCSAEQVRRYRARISGPLLDRIDIQIEVPAMTMEILHARADNSGESSATVRQRVCQAYQRQLARTGKPNGKLGSKEIEQYCPLDAQQMALLEQAVDRLHLSTRAMHRILKVARTIADLEARDRIQLTHLTEAISYRRFERQPD